MKFPAVGCVDTAPLNLVAYYNWLMSYPVKVEYTGSNPVAIAKQCRKSGYPDLTEVRDFMNLGGSYNGIISRLHREDKGSTPLLSTNFADTTSRWKEALR